MAIFPLAPDQTIAQMWSNEARGEISEAVSLGKSEVMVMKIYDEVVC